MRYDGVAPAELAARLKAPGCLSLVSVTSTMDIVHELAAEGAPAGIVVLADEQVAGRGRQGRRWHSPRGGGIWLGYLVRPARATEAGVLALRVGLALAESLADIGVDVRLKWPNDVLLQDRKLAGILCEARWSADRLSWIAVGLGINVSGPLPAELRAHAITLREVANRTTRIEVLQSLVPRLHGLSDAAALSEAERAAYARRDWLTGRSLSAPVTGLVRGVDAQGALLVDGDRGLTRVVGGSVTCS